MKARPLHRFSPAMLQAALWALRARILARRAVLGGAGAWTSVPLPPAPRGPLEAERAVIGVLGRTHAKCLVRALVLQRWLADQGQAVDVVIGVTSPAGGFEAHAWLDRDDDGGRFVELHRLKAPDPGITRTRMGDQHAGDASC